MRIRKNQRREETLIGKEHEKFIFSQWFAYVYVVVIFNGINVGTMPGK